MAYFRSSLHRGFAVCLAVGAAFGALFGLALLATAVTGNSAPSSILLGGFGFILLALSVLVLVFVIRQRTLTKHGPDS